MKKRLGLCILGIILLVSMWRLLLHSSPESNQTAKNNAARSDASPSKEHASSPTVLAPVNKEISEELENKIISKELYEDGTKSNVPIQFYGMVVDQDGNGIPGVKVKAEVSAFNETFIKTRKDSDYRKKTSLEMTTDNRGFFTIQNIDGNYLVIKDLEKLGYQADTSNLGAFVYWDRNDPSRIHIPSSQKPVVFHIWRENGSEQLIYAKKFYGIIPDGRAFTIDLIKQKKMDSATSEGDLRVKIMRPPQVDPQIKYDWSCVIEVIGGGILEAADQFLYRAPESGYQPNYQLIVNASDPQWSDKVTKTFYVKSREGKVYSSMTFEIFINYDDKSALSLNYLSNPAGSRNLEYDPQKKINK
jgi:hypothetical protein